MPLEGMKNYIAAVLTGLVNLLVAFGLDLTNAQKAELLSFINIAIVPAAWIVLRKLTDGPATTIKEFMGGNGPKLLPLLLLMTMGGCQVNGPAETTLGQSIVKANLGLMTIAETALAACGNTSPGGDCTSTSQLTRADVDEIKVSLLDAGRLLDVAATGGIGNDGPLIFLKTAQAVLAELRQTLLSKGVPTE